MGRTRTVPAWTLRPGDRILYHDTEVTILSEPEELDQHNRGRFGIDAFMIQARRHDTGAVGPLRFGTGGIAHLISRAGAARRRATPSRPAWCGRPR